MSNRKKQSVAAAMATVIGVGTLISPVAVHAQDEEPPTAITQETAVNSTQENDSSIQEKEKGDSALLIDTEYKNEIDTMLSSIEKNADDAFTNLGVAEKAIVDALKSYEFSNETTQQDIQDFLNQQFVDTGKLKEIPIRSYSVSTNPTTTDKGIGSFVLSFTLMNGTNSFFDYRNEFYIPRLPKEGEVAINSKNFPDPLFKKYVKYTFDADKDDVLSVDEISNITDIDLSQFAGRVNIESLQGIEYFTELKNLNCYGTGNAILNVSSNTKLEILRCGGNANLTTLNVKGVKTLKKLQCYNTGITSLDVSNNKNLEALWCQNTPLAWLNIGDNTKLGDLTKSNSTIDINVTGNTFNIKDMFKGIDVENVTITSNGSLDKATGIVTVTKAGQPVIYTYNCGTSKNGAETLQVTLNLSIQKKDSSITINKDLKKDYDGNAVSLADSDITVTGSSNKATYTWEQKKGEVWETISTAPVNVGDYRIKVRVEGDDFFNSKEEYKEFTIAQAINSWITDLDIDGWTYSESANPPTAKASFGDVVFTYSDSKNGAYTTNVPTNAGTWYVKATLTGTDNYTVLESVEEFIIAPKYVDNNSQIVITDLNSDEDLENLVIKDDDKVLVKGSDYNVDKNQSGNKVTVTITFKGNYTGTVTKTYTVAIDTPKDEVKETENIQTGDHTQTGLLATISLLSAGCIAFLTGKKRKKYNR